ncbi:MAG: M14 family zinc carboxypeptidase [Candidatus Hodarchaeales archaeon]
MIIEEILKSVPAFKEFMTIEELDNSSKRLADEFETVDLINFGRSTAGRSINYLKIGDGEKNALLFAFPHPNEPIGSLTIEFLARFLAENPDVTKELGYTWYLIKAIDPDGAALNEGWFKGKFEPVKYVKHYYRPAPYEQIEWTFPVTYKKLSFSNPPPETQALMKVIEETKPSFMFSLHNAGFCGVYYYVSHEIKTMFPKLIDLVKQEKLPLHRGEPEAPFIKELHPAIYQLLGIQESYDFYEEQGVENPQELIKCGTSSDEYLNRVTNGQGFTLICEMPYYYDKAVGDHSKSTHDRREKVLESLEFSQETHKFTKLKFESIRNYCNSASRIFTSVADSVDNFDKRISPQIHHAKTASMYEGKATVAQVFDTMVARKIWGVYRGAMIARLCKEAAIIHPKRLGEFNRTQEELNQWVEQTITETLKKTDFEIIPIQKLVKVQVGSALITIQHLQ